MFSLLSPLSKYFKVKSVRIHDGVFIFHSKITVSILIACSVIISAKQYFGDPIDCISDGKNHDFINNFCWTFGTYILQYSGENISRYNNKNYAKSELIAYGVGTEISTSKRIYLRYYQWVVLILLLQALSFYLPSFLWKVWENGRLQQLCNELGSVLIQDVWGKGKRQMLITYFTSNYKDIHMCYALKYAFCEVLNCAICVLNILLMNVFFSGFWSNYAPALSVISSYNWDKWNEMSSKVFPKLAKCEFFNIGFSGSQQKWDVLCLLPLNILNEKLFAFLWIWFIMLMTISGLNIIYRIFVISSSKFRFKLLRAQLRSMKSKDIKPIFDNMNFGDWFILYRVSNNINPVIFTELMQSLSNENTKMTKKNDAGDYEDHQRLV